MFEGNLADFEELVLSVRDKNSREYIGEAAANYRSRCFRSAISAAWVAVTFDIISKIRELSQQGDGSAKAFIARVDAAITVRTSNPVESKKLLQKIENELLSVAHGQFEFLTDQDLRNMERLWEDRHLCSHPAFSGDDQLFQPSAELVRMHIVHAITGLLQHPPIQGKAALQRFKNDLLQASFPSTQTTVSDFLDARYLRHIKSGLVDNLITSLLKVIIKQSEPELRGKEEAVLMCLVAIQRRHPQRFTERARHEVSRLSDRSEDDELRRVMRLFRADRRCWNWLGKASQIQITEIVKNYVFDRADLDAVASCLEIDELRPLFAARAAGFTTGEKNVLYVGHPNQVFIDDAIKEYAEASSYRGAEELFDAMIRPFITVFRPEHIRTIVDGARTNGQIYAAAGTREQLAYLFERTSDLLSDTASVWQAYLQKVTEVYDKDGRHFCDLRERMIKAGISPASVD